MDFQNIKKEVGTYWRLGVLTTLCVATIFVFYFAFRTEQYPLKVVFLDVGQGDAIFIESPTGNQVIFDGGPGSTLVSQVSKHMSLFDRTIDMIVVTNPDKDHFEGFIPLLERYKVTTLLEPGVIANKNQLYRELKNSAKQKNVTALVARTGERILLGGGAYIDIVFPDRDVEDVSHNDGSLVARLVFGKTSVLLTGDTTKNIENYLVSKYPEMLDADILKVAHHGSNTSTTDAFVKAVSPYIAVISAGKGNSYGHPRKETLDTLLNNKVQTLVTMSEGAIVFESDGKKFVRK